MAFQKGRSKTGGIKKGQIQNRTRQWQEIGDYLTNQGVDRVLTVLNQSSDNDFMNYFDHLIRYFKPQLSSIATKEEVENETEIEMDKEQKEDLDNAIDDLVRGKISDRLDLLEDKTYSRSEIKALLSNIEVSKEIQV